MSGTGTPGLLIGGGGALGAGPPPSRNIFQIHCINRLAFEGGRGWRKEAQRLWGSWGLRRGPRRAPSTQLPPTLTCCLGEHSALCPVLPHLPHNGGSPSSDLCTACGPLNKGWPLLVIKISEETLKRKPLGQGLGRPQAALPARGQDIPPVLEGSPAGRQTNAPHPLWGSPADRGSGRKPASSPGGPGSSSVFPTEAARGSGKAGQGRRRLGSGLAAQGLTCPAVDTPGASWAAGHFQ